MEKLIAKYTAYRSETQELLTHTGNVFERESLIEQESILEEIVSDLEAAHRNCSCRTGLKWNAAEHDELLTDREQFFID